MVRAAGLTHEMENRTVHAIMIRLKSERERSVIVWIKDTLKLCVRLMNPRRTWTTARAGDAVMMTHNGTKARSTSNQLNCTACFRRNITAKQSNRLGRGSIAAR